MALVWDEPRRRYICSRCKRMYGGPNPDNFEYADKPAAMTAMREHRQRKIGNSVSTRAMVDRILKDRF